MRPADTHPDAYAAHISIVRRLGPSGRLATTVQMSDELQAMQRDAIRTRHPEYSDADVWFAQVRLRLGDELFIQVWPNAPKLEP